MTESCQIGVWWAGFDAALEPLRDRGKNCRRTSGQKPGKVEINSGRQLRVRMRAYLSV